MMASISSSVNSYKKEEEKEDDEEEKKKKRRRDTWASLLGLKMESAPNRIIASISSLLSALCCSIKRPKETRLN